MLRGLPMGYSVMLQRGRAHVSAEIHAMVFAPAPAFLLQRGRAHVSAEITRRSASAAGIDRFNGAALT